MMFFMLQCISFNNILAHMGIFDGVRNIFIQYSLLDCLQSVIWPIRSWYQNLVSRMGDIKTKSAGSPTSFFPPLHLGASLWVRMWYEWTQEVECKFCIYYRGRWGNVLQTYEGIFQSFSLGHNKESLQALKTDKLDLWIYWVIFSAFLSQELGRHYLQGLLRAS